MLGEFSLQNKENCYRSDQLKEHGNLYQGTIFALRAEIDTLKNDKHHIQKQWVQEVDLLKLEIQQYKKKLSSLTDKYLLETLSKQQQQEPPKDYQRLLREKDVMLDHERDNKKKLQEQLRGKAEEEGQHRKEIERLQAEKQKLMEITLVEKMDLEERAQLLEEEVESKKKIIANLKKELEKIYSEKEALNKQERSLAQKSKELECYSKEINEYNRLNELKMRQQVCHLKQENQFLKEYLKKMETLAQKDCDCQAKDQQMRDKVYHIQRELALAKVKLEKNCMAETQRKKRGREKSSDSESSYSFERKK